LAYTVEYARSVAKDLAKLPRDVKRRALEIIEGGLAQDPYWGKALTGPFRGLWKARVGDYRIVYAIEDARLVVFVLRIRHRKDVYRGLTL
jgi:mRNA interferase RelE/StbE